MSEEMRWVAWIVIVVYVAFELRRAYGGWRERQERARRRRERASRRPGARRDARWQWRDGSSGR